MKKIDFIEKAKLAHGDRYNYDLVVYINNKIKINIICNKHGEFLQTPDGHLSGHGCSRCAYEYKLTQKQTKHYIKFIEKSKLIYNDFYDYKMVKYLQHNKKVIIICPIHGEFLQTPKFHMNGNGCRICNKVSSNSEEFIKKSNKLHKNFYDYKLTNYINSKKHVKIFCFIHGEFEQKPNDHLNGHGCHKCASEKNGMLKKNNQQLKYVDIANNVHNNKYNYSLMNYVDSKHKIIINCPIHGNFTQYPQEHLRGYGCQKCKMSRGELEIIKILEKFSILYVGQKQFDGCINKRKLSFDFYLSEHNVCIEYDGLQHHEPVKFRNYSNEKSIKMFEYVKFNDSIKNKYCEINNIKLFRIKYDENIEFEMNKIISSLDH